MKPSELFKCTNWEFTQASSKEENCHKKPSLAPLYPRYLTRYPVLTTTWSQIVYALNVEGDWKGQRGYRPTPRLTTLSSSSHARPSALFHSVLGASLPAVCSWRFHTTSLTKLNIFLNLLCGRGTHFSAFPRFQAEKAEGRQKRFE